MGRLHRLHRGVYLLGHSVAPPLARETAAILACGPGAVLSHASAGGLWGILETPPGAIDVTVAGRDCGRRVGVRHHRARRLLDADVRWREGLPVTAPARTLIDLAAALDDRSLERAVNEALVSRIASEDDIAAALYRSRARPGVPALRRLLEQAREPRLTRSEAEERLLMLIRKSGLPAPRTNVKLDTYEVDFLWSAARLVVEVDGFAFHSTRAAFERDRRRDADLQARGLTVMRLTWRQIVEEPEATVVRLTRLLDAGNDIRRASPTRRTDT